MHDDIIFTKHTIYKFITFVILWTKINKNKNIYAYN